MKSQNPFFIFGSAPSRACGRLGEIATVNLIVILADLKDRGRFQSAFWVPGVSQDCAPAAELPLALVKVYTWPMCLLAASLIRVSKPTRPNGKTR